MLPAFHLLPARRLLATALTSAFASLAAVGSAHAALNPLSKTTYDAASGRNTVDMVFSVSWDLANPPANRSQSYLENVLKSFAKTVFSMTEGKMQIGNVYVYGNRQFADNADSLLISGEGRSNASLNGFNGGRGMTMTNYTTMSGQDETETGYGQVIAHEWGHYGLGLYDEYREAGGTSTDDGSPQDGDTPKNSIMHDQYTWQNLSTVDDYADTATRKTAHFRVYGKSAWETLVQDPAQDSALSKSYGLPDRNSYQSFRALGNAPAKASLTLPTTGWEGAFKINYMGAAKSGGPLLVLALDQTLPNDAFEAAKNAAQQAIDRASADTRIAILAYPYGTTTPVSGFQSVGTAKDALKTAINGLTSTSAASGANASADRLFDWAEATYPQLFTTKAASQTIAEYYVRAYPGPRYIGTQGDQLYFLGPESNNALLALGPMSNMPYQSDLNGALQKALDLIGASKKDGDTPSVMLLAGAAATADGKFTSSYQSAGVALNAVAIRGQGSLAASGGKSLADLVKDTKGRFDQVSKPGALAKVTARSINGAEGDDEVSLGEGGGDVITAGGKSSLTLPVSSDVDGGLYFSAQFADADQSKLTFTLTTPSGQVLTGGSSLPAGITFALDNEEGEASFSIADSVSGRSGNWTLTVSASSSTSDAVYLDASTHSALDVDANVVGNVLTAAVRGSHAVIGATVTADVFDMNGNKVSSLTLLDDGKLPDYRHADGVYSVNLGTLAKGDYDIEVTVTNASGTASYTDSGSLKSGSNTVSQKLGSFRRFTAIEHTVQ
jgi:hypothetical protein